MTTLLPKDADNNIIPALRLRDNGAHQITAAATANRNNIPFNPDTKIISIYATVPVYIAFGGSNIDANTSDHFFPAGVYYDIAISGGNAKGSQKSYLSVLQASDGGTVFISEKE